MPSYKQQPDSHARGGAHAAGGAHATPSARSSVGSRAPAGSHVASGVKKDAFPVPERLDREEVFREVSIESTAGRSVSVQHAAYADARHGRTVSESAPRRSSARPETAPKRKSARREEAPGRGSGSEKPPRTSSRAPVLTVLSALAGLVLAGLLTVLFVAGIFRVRYILPDGGRKSELVFRGQTANKAPPVSQEGYTFIGWEDEQGQIVPADMIPVYEDLVYTARMMPVLNNAGHPTYLSPDESGLIHPDELLLRGQAAQILCTFLDVPAAVGGENFSDVGRTASYASATATLKALGAAEGELFRPEEPVTLRELLTMLGSFYPVLTWEDLAIYGEGADPSDPDEPYLLRYTFKDISQLDPDYARFCTAASLGWIDSGPDVEISANDALTRAQAAAFLNRALGRGQGLEIDPEQAGKFIDLPPDHPLYAQVMEAAVPHSVGTSGEAESWNSAQPYETEAREPGFFCLGTQLYCLGEDGYLVTDEEVNGFTFGPDGKFTSGKPELDELVQQVLGQIITPDMDGTAKLRAAYDYVRDSFTYIKGNHHQRGDVSWAVDEAYDMFATGYGNCYNYAGAFYALCRALGQDATLVSGLYGSNYLMHAWVEFTVDGERRICDPEVEMTYYRAEKPEEEIPDMFMMTVAYSNRWRYTK